MTFFGGIVVSLEGFVSDIFVFFIFLVFTDISVVVTFHFKEENFAFSGFSLRYEVFIDKAKDIVTEFIELFFDFLFIVSDELGLIGITSLSFFDG